jgi:hypothetical protein
LKENNLNKTLWITTTGILIALVIGMQAVTAALGQMVTGSLVNLTLIVAVMLCGLPSGLTVAVITPVAAKLLGIGPLWSIIPFIILGNAVIVIVWHFINKMSFANKHIVRCTAVVAGAVCKFVTLYLGIVQLAVPFLLELPAPQAAVVSGLFSVPQLFTSLIGGTIAALILPVLEKAVKPKFNA